MNAHRNIAALPVRFVALSEIPLSPGPFTVSFAFDPSPLVRSIDRIGLTTSPLLVHAEETGYEIVTGFRRVHAVCSLGWKEVPCRILQANETSPTDCLLISLYDNLFTRSFNEVERGMALSRLVGHMDVDQILDRFMPLMGLASRKETLEFYVAFDRRLDEGIKRQLAAGILSRDTAIALLGLDGSVARVMAGAINNLRFNINDQRNFIDYIIDISNNKTEKILDLINGEDFQGILADSEQNPPQRAAAALRLLRGRRNPMLAAAEETFRRRVSGLGLPRGARIEAPPFFEAPGYRLIIPFKDGRGLKRTLRNLLELKDLEGLADPWEMK